MFLDGGSPRGSDQRMDKEQVGNICVPAGHTVAGKTFPEEAEVKTET